MSYPPPRPTSGSTFNQQTLDTQHQPSDHPTPSSQQGHSPLDWSNFMNFQTPPVSQAGPAGNGMPGGYGATAGPVNPTTGGGMKQENASAGTGDNYGFAQGAHVNQRNRQGSMMFQQPPYTNGQGGSSYPPPSPNTAGPSASRPLNGKGKSPAHAPPLHRQSSGNIASTSASDGLSLDPAAFSRDIRFQIPSFLSNNVGGAPTFPPGGEAWSGFSGPGMMNNTSGDGMGGLTPGQLFNSMFNLPDGRSPTYNGGDGYGGWDQTSNANAWNGWENPGKESSTMFYVNPNPSPNPRGQQYPPPRNDMPSPRNNYSVNQNQHQQQQLQQQQHQLSQPYQPQPLHQQHMLAGSSPRASGNTSQNAPQYGNFQQSGSTVNNNLSLAGPASSSISTSALLPNTPGYSYSGSNTTAGAGGSAAFPFVPSISESTNNSVSTVNIASSSTAPYAPPSNTEQLLTAPVAPAVLGPSLADGPGLYSTTGFDMVGVLARVAARKEPKTVLGPVDLSCSFAVVGTNCPKSSAGTADSYKVSLMSVVTDPGPDGEVVKGSKRKYTDNVAVAHLKRMLNAGKECQASLINYRRGGIPFINLVTVVPIPWEGTDIVYHVGFQVDLVEQPNAILRNMRDGSYQVNYTVANPPQPPLRPAGREPGASGLSSDVLEIMGAKVNAPNFAQGEEGGKMDWLKMVLENSDDFIHVLSLKGMFQYVSPSVRRVLQYEPEELLNKNISDICHPSDIVPLMRELKDSTHAPSEGSTARQVNLVFRIRHKHSGYVWIECTGRLHVEPGKGRKAVIVSGRARSVPSLPWEVISRHGGLAEKEFWAKLSFQGLMTHATSTVSDVLGQKAEDIIGHSFFSILPGGDNGPPHPSMIENDPSSPVSVVANAFQTVTSSSIKKDGGVMITHKLVKRSGELVDVITILYAPKSRPELPHRSDSENDGSSSSASSPSSGSSGPTPTYSLLRPSSIVAQIKLLSGSNLLPSSSSSSPSNPATIANLTNARPVAHSGTSNLFEELETTRGTSWQYELHQLRLLNRRLKDDVLAARSVARANAAKGKGRKRKVGEEMGPPPPPPQPITGKLQDYNAAAPRHQMAPGFGLLNPNIPNPYF